MFRMTQYLDKHLCSHIDFGSFHLLALIPRFGKDAVVLLVPKDLREDKHFNLQCGTTSLWYSSLDNMLTAAREYYGSKVWHSNSKYRRVIWQCNSKFKGDHKYGTPHLYETDIQRLFMSAVSKLYADRKTILETCRLLQSTLTDNTSIDAECDELLREMDVVAGLIRSCIEENACQAVDQASYIERYNGYVERYESLKDRYTRLQVKREERDAEALRIGGFMFELRELDELPITFDERLWHGLIDHVTVYDDERLVFHFKDGSEIGEQL